MCEQKIAGIIEKYRGKPGAVIHALTEIQHENHWLPRSVMQQVAEALEVPFSQVMQIASFYKTFSLTPKGRHEVHVCTGMTCHLRGGAKLMEKVAEITGLNPGDQVIQDPPDSLIEGERVTVVNLRGNVGLGGS